MPHRYTEDTLVAVGSIWHADCDPFMTVAVARPGANDGTKFQTLENIIERAILEETETVLAEDCDDECDEECQRHLPDLRWADSEERLGFLELSEDELQQLERNGYVYIAR